MSAAAPRLAVTGTSYAGGVVLQIVVQALSLPVLTRLLEPAGYGLVATALVAANLLAVVVDLGLSRVVTRAWFRGVGGPAQAETLVVAALASAAVLSALVLLSSPLWSGWLGDDGARTLQAAVGLGAAMAARNVVLGLLRAADRARGYLLVMVLSTSAAQLLALLTAARGGTASSYVAGLAAGSGLALLIGLLLVRPRLGRLRTDGLWPWAVRFGLLLVPAELAGVAIWFADRIVVERLLGLVEVGRYQVAYTLGSVLLMLAMGVSQAWAPVLFRADDAERPALASRTRALLLGLGGWGAAGLALLAPPVLLAAIPADYRPAGLFGLTAVVALCVLPLLAQQGAAHLLTAAERGGVLAVAAVLTALLNIVVTVALVSVLGLLGAALATLLTYVVWAALLTRAAARLAGGCFVFTATPWLVGGSGALAGAMLPASGWGLAVRLIAAAACGVFALRSARSLLEERVA